MKKFSVALQVYSVRDYAETNFKETMEKVKKMGYDGIELAGLYGKTAAQVKNILDEVGLTLVSAHEPIADLENDEVLDDYASIGIKYMVIPWMSVEPNEESVNSGLVCIKAIAERCKQRNLQLLYHNHDFEFEKVDGNYILDIYYKKVSEDLLKTEIDTCWVNVGGENPSEYLLKYTGRAPVVHLKDFVGKKSENMYALIGSDKKKEDTTGAFEFRPVGFGVQNFSDILEVIKKVGAEWVVVEQDKPSMGKTSIECAKMSIDYLKSIM